MKNCKFSAILDICPQESSLRFPWEVQATMSPFVLFWKVNSPTFGPIMGLGARSLNKIMHFCGEPSQLKNDAGDKLD